MDKELNAVRDAQAEVKTQYGDAIRACQRGMYIAAYAILRHEQDALDAVQDAILAGWRKRNTLRQPEYFKTWITRITINKAKNILRRRRHTLELPLEEAGTSTDVDAALDVRRALLMLDEKTRLCAMLYYYEDLPVHEIAATLGIATGTVKSRLHRARQQLKQELRGYWHETDA